MDNKRENTHTCSTPADAARPGRRTFLQWLTGGLGALAAAAVGLPFVGYLLRTRQPPNEWVDLGPVNRFPIDQTRMATFDNPIRVPWDGIVAHTGVYVRREDGSSLLVQLAPDNDGMRVTEIVEGSSAAEAGLQVGDVLTKLDGIPLPDLTAFTSALATRQPGQLAVLTLTREGRENERSVRLDPRFLVLAVNCAHLGCPVSWFPQSGLFMCPCHGGVYYANGDRASGPPPRGLFRCTWRVRAGRLEVQSPHYPTLQDPLTKDDKGTA